MLQFKECKACRTDIHTRAKSTHCSATSTSSSHWSLVLMMHSLASMIEEHPEVRLNIKARITQSTLLLASHLLIRRATVGIRNTRCLRKIRRRIETSCTLWLVSWEDSWATMNNKFRTWSGSRVIFPDNNWLISWIKRISNAACLQTAHSRFTPTSHNCCSLCRLLLGVQCWL